MPINTPPSPDADADAAPCPTCTRYSCRCGQTDGRCLRLAPWTEAFAANA